MSVIYKIQKRVIVVPPGTTRGRLIDIVMQDWATGNTAFHRLDKPFVDGELQDPWTLEYPNLVPCDINDLPLETIEGQHPVAIKYAKVLSHMLAGLDPKHETVYSLVDFSQWSTFNDGGTAYSAVFKTYDGGYKYIRVTIPSDYNPQTVKVTSVKPVSNSHTEYK